MLSATDQDAASYSRDYLMALLTMLTRSPEVGDILVVGHSVGAKLTADALQQHWPGKAAAVMVVLAALHRLPFYQSDRVGG